MNYILTPYVLTPFERTTKHPLDVRPKKNSPVKTGILPNKRYFSMYNSSNTRLYLAACI